MFRFHTGSIKSAVRCSDNKDTGKFRFHTGSIKRRLPRQSRVSFVLFRFHTGSIKSSDYTLTTARAGGRFRFHTGSIKSPFDDIELEFWNVSIPYWFD